MVVSALLAAASTVARAEGPGLKLGDQLVLHLGIAGELRYDSNVFFASSGEVGALIVRLMPSIDLATRPAQRLNGVVQPHTADFRLHLGADYNEFVTNRDVTASHRSVGIQAGALLTLFPQHLFTIDVYDNYVRTVQPPYTEVPYNLDRDTNEAGFRLRYRPGGGRLEIDLSYTFGLDFFEPQSGAPALTDLNVYYHRINLHGQWAFFPKTAVYIDVTETPYVYASPIAATTAFNHPNSFPLRVIAGVNGLITNKLTVNGWVGYGNGFYETVATLPTTNPNTAIGGVDLRWRPIVFSTGGLGYKHDFVNSLLGSYYDVDGIYVLWEQLLWRFTLAAKLTYQHLSYAGIPASAGVQPQPPPAMAVPLVSRNDNNIILDTRVEYPFKDYLTASVGYTLQYNNSDSALVNPMSPVSPAVLVPLNYLKHEVWLRLSVLY